MALSPEELELKRAIYDKLSPRRRKFIDRIGFDAWDPFQQPKDPIDIRQDENKLSSSELMSGFMAGPGGPHRANKAYMAGAMDMCLGIINKHDRMLGMFDFVRWYLEAVQAAPQLPDLRPTHDNKG